MPTTRFATNALRGAIPGLGRLAQAIGGAGGAYQQGFDAESALQSRLATAIANARQSEAAADKYGAEADETRAKTALLGRRPELFEEQVAAASGSAIPLVRAVRESLRTGATPMIPGVELAGPTEDGQPLGGMVPAEQRSRIGQQLQRLAPMLLNAGDFKIDDWQKAQGGYREMDLGDDVLAGRRSAGAVGAAQAAAAGKPLYNSDANGAVLDLFAGALDTENPMAQGTLRLRDAQTVAQRANAAQSYAAARKSDAERLDGANRGGAKAPTGYRWNADGQGLEPIPGGPADPNTKGAKLAKPPTEGQAKALMFGSRMAVADELLRDLEGDGATRPGLIKQAAQGVAGAVPIIGDSLAAGAGAVTNWTQSNAQQQVEQAQRDFINAVLRRESGAVISPQEFANAAQQYFPQMGDSPQVLRQKAANRMTAIRGMQAEFGEAAMPQFREIVQEARAARQTQRPGAKPNQATAKPAQGWAIERID